MTRDEVGQRETAYHHLVMGRPDALEGVMAFLERRPAALGARRTPRLAGDGLTHGGKSPTPAA